MRSPLRPLVALAAMVACTPLAAQVQGGANEARRALRSGQYDDAIGAYREILRTTPAAVQMRVDLMEALVSTGAYEEAIEVGRAAPNPAAVANATGEALLRLGRDDEAEAAFRAAAGGEGPYALTAEVNLAELLFNRGEIDEAMARFDRFIDVYNGATGQMRAPDLVAVGRAVRYLGRDSPQLFQDALRAFDEAAAADPDWAEPHVRLGDLFLEKYDSPSAQEEYLTVLERNPNHPGALLGMARALWFDGTASSRPQLENVLRTDPNNVEARALLARQLHLSGGEGYREAHAMLDTALTINPNSLFALTVRAGLYMLVDDDPAMERIRSQVLALNPRYAGMDADLADLAVRVRRYGQAVERAAAAVALDSSQWEAWGLLGMNQFRLGLIDEGRANLERAFEGDPYNPWFKNSLDLLDTYDRYTVHATEHFELFLNRSEADLLALYLEPIVEEAYDSLSRHYGVEPPLPVRAEFYPSHADFSVRTLGETGLGALGVSFGKVVVMDSPSARELGEYNWASVFWHELSHSFHLASSNDRVPRWFSEGLAVHEQRKARVGWGHRPTIPFLQALAGNRLKDVSELDDGFMRPDYPEQVIFSYFQASLVFQVIEERFGYDKILDMIDGYRQGGTDDWVFENVVGVPLDEFDDEFDDWLRERFRTPLRAMVAVADPPPMQADLSTMEDFVRRHPGDFIGRMRLGALLMREERYDEAEAQFQEAVSMFPEYGQPDSPYWFLAQIHRERGELERAAAALARLNSLFEANYHALVTEADVLEELGRPEQAAAALSRAVLIWPFEIELHRRLAQLDADIGDHEGAVRERRAVVFLNPPDRAEALFRLATAERDSGDVAAARRSVLRALEIAPNYAAALELLLELRSAR